LVSLLFVGGGRGKQSYIQRRHLGGSQRGNGGGQSYIKGRHLGGGRGAFAPPEFEKELLFCVAHNLFFFTFCPHLESHSGTSLEGRGQRGTILYSETSFGGKAGGGAFSPP